MIPRFDYDLLVTGNGLDLSLGLPTRFGDFYDAILLAKKYSNNIDEFLNNSLTISSEDKAKEFYLKVIRLLETNYFVKYILGYKRKFENWCEFEKELEYILVSFDNLLSKLKPESSPGFGCYDIEVSGFERYDIFLPEICPDWNGFSFSIYNDFTCFEIRDTKYKGPYDKASLQRRINQVKEEIIFGLFNDLNNFKILFQLYLSYCIDLDNITLNNAPFVRDAITFNYTKTTERIIRNNVTVFHIHGKSDEKIVLGVDDSIHFLDFRFNRFLKSTQRSKIINDVSFEQITRGTARIYYFGLSFDKGDTNSLKRLLTLPDARHIIYYLNDKEDSNFDSIISNVQAILTVPEYEKKISNGTIVFLPSSSFKFEMDE